MAASPPNALPWATGATRSRRVLVASRRRSGSAYPLDASFAGTRSATAPPGAASSRARSTNATARSGRCVNPGPPAARQDVGEVRFEREERGTALAGETARGHPELAATGAHPPEQRALVRPEPPPPSEQIAILARGDQF